MEEGEIVAIVRMPDGRYAAANRTNLKDLTIVDLEQILGAFKLWWSIQWDIKRPQATPE